MNDMPRKQVSRLEKTRESIYGAAIELFAKQGFDETTVDEIAAAAGVSRRSFFRYFSSKDDLLAQSVVAYGKILADAVRSSEDGLPWLKLIESILLAGVSHISSHKQRSRQVMTIAKRSSSARQAHQSRLGMVEDQLTEAFANKSKDPQNAVRSRLLAGITLAAMSSCLIAWYEGEQQTLAGAAHHVLGLLMHEMCEGIRDHPGQ